MRLDGIGNEHSAQTHHVTAHMHEHSARKHTTGGLDLLPKGGNAEQTNRQPAERETYYSLGDRMRKLFNNGIGALKNFWAGDTAAQVQGNATRPEEAQATAYHTASPQMKTEEKAVQANPYFATLPSEKKEAPTSLTSAIRMKIGGALGYLTGKMPGNMFKFQAKNSFSAKSDQKSKEDLSRRSRYKKDKLEIDCILTDESYLMDSYDKNGEYSTLTTKK